MPQIPYNSPPEQVSPFSHVPVLHTTVLTVLAPKPGERVLDVTLGLGGHAQLFLDAIGPAGTLTGLDTDERNLAVARRQLEGRGAAEFLHASFLDLPALNLPAVDILFADLGLSSPHLDDPARGFSFRFDGPLDMRLDASKGMTAEELILRSSAEELGHIFADYGQFAGSMRLGRVLAGSHIATTFDLKSAVEKAFGFKGKALLPQIFQALR
ncbi:16S rRNA (cytosine(1402)-N(4))-methyltransferase, partial [Candidatus Peregrinibacteria bacterium]|nr:16S rRNA (cytosine(1402)-N(4))-methyltransferase [Candidatus Peregrinibacteria bacterium]